MAATGAHLYSTAKHHRFPLTPALSPSAVERVNRRQRQAGVRGNPVVLTRHAPATPFLRSTTLALLLAAGALSAAPADQATEEKPRSIVAVFRIDGPGTE